MWNTLIKCECEDKIIFTIIPFLSPKSEQQQNIYNNKIRQLRTIRQTLV